MGGFLGIGGSSAKTDRTTTLAGYGDLSNIFSFAMPTATSLTAAGTAGLDAASGYWQKLLSGNRATALSAIAPETSAIEAGEDATRRQMATSGTARGGGVASTAATAHDKSMSEIDTAIMGARPQAAGEVAKIGSTEVSAGLNALGLGENAAADLTKDAISSRTDSYAINKDTQGNVVGAIEAFMGAL